MKKVRGTAAILATVLAATSLTGCGADETIETEAQAFVPEIVGTYEAEDASFTGNVHAASAKSGYSGTGYADGFQTEGDSCTFTISVDADGFYDLNFVTAASAYKENIVTVDGGNIGNIVTDTTDFAEDLLKRVYLTAGEHEVTVSEYWGYFNLDCLIVQTSEPLPTNLYDVDATLANPNATENTKRLMSYLADNYGTNILSGQYSQDGMYGKEFVVVKNETGKNPAILGLDFIEYSPSRAANGSTDNATELAIAYWKQGGIVTFCWHWNAPEKYLISEWYNGFRTEGTNIDLAAIMNGEDEEGYALLMDDIDAIAKQLLILQEAGVPILWRPLHEASGGWFWWGASGAEAYKQLYILLYETLTEEYGLNNLIWLWNGQDGDWYPGDEYVDIIGEDLYPGEHAYTSQVNTYLQAVHYTDTRKMVVMSENGCVFDPKLAIRDGAMWGFFCTWGQEFVAKDTSIYAYSDQYTESEKLAEFYANDAVITLDELPDLTTYPIRKELQ